MYSQSTDLRYWIRTNAAAGYLLEQSNSREYAESFVRKGEYPNLTYVNIMRFRRTFI